MSHDNSPTPSLTSAPDPQSTPITLRTTIRSARETLLSAIASARVNSPFADHKLRAADDAVASVIHTGYSAVKSIIVHGNPAVILTTAAVVAAAPSLPFGPRALVRNTGLTVALTAVMIYPDHLKKHMMTASQPSSPPSDS